LPKAHLGRFGIGLTATNEDGQINIMQDTDPRMIAPNKKGDATKWGSYVADLNKEYEIDPDPGARLRRSGGCTARRTGESTASWPTMSGQGRVERDAWNLTTTGLEGALGRGAVIDNAWESGSPGPDVPTPAGSAHL